MPLHIPNGFAHCVFGFTMIETGERMAVTIGCPVGAYALPDGLANALVTLWSNPGRPFAAASMQNSYTFTGVRVTIGQTGDDLIGEAQASVTGTITSGAMPPQCAVLVTKKSAYGGRRNRGRMYVPPFWMPESNVSAGGVIPGSALPSLQGYMDSVHAAMAANDITPVILHHYPENTGPFGGGEFVAPAPTPITAFVVQPKLATQRRRIR